MEILKYDEIDLQEVVKRSGDDVNNVIGTVSNILADVKESGDEALKNYTKKFDNVELDDLKVSNAEIEEAYQNIDSQLATLKNSIKKKFLVNGKLK